MASYQDLLDAIARVGTVTGDSRAWLTGLSDADLATITSPVSIVAPSAIDNVVAKIRAQHGSVFDPSPAAQSQTPGRARQRKPFGPQKHLWHIRIRQVRNSTCR